MKRKGFTLVELLVVISIISILMAILVPGINAVKRQAKNIQQGSQLHLLKIGLETFASDNDNDYPDSSSGSSSPTGAQRLTESLVGRDYRGFSSDGMYLETNYGERSGSYIDIEKFTVANATQIYVEETLDEDVFGKHDGQIYDANGCNLKPLFTDVFLQRKIEEYGYDASGNYGNKGSALKIGTPILYFAAGRTKDFLYPNGIPSGIPNWADAPSWKYDITDNYHLLSMQTLKSYEEGLNLTTRAEHHIYDYDYDGNFAISAFYTDITNDNISTYAESFNPDSYILISAGYDGVFGTKDDITNFNK